MNLSKNQKRLVCVLGVSLVALVSDQMFMSPGSVSASPDASRARPAADHAASAPDPQSATARRAQHVARWGARDIQRRLVAATRPALAGRSEPRDIFFPVPPSPRPAVALVDSAPTDKALRAPVPPPVIEADPVQEFRSKYELRAIIASGKGKSGTAGRASDASASVALVNDRMLRLGEGIGGFRLIAIERAAVVFELAAPRPGRSGPPPRVRLTVSDSNNHLPN